MNEIRDSLDIMNLLEILLNLETKDTLKAFKELTIEEQENFVSNLKSHLEEVNQTTKEFLYKVSK